MSKFNILKSRISNFGLTFTLRMYYVKSFSKNQKYIDLLLSFLRKIFINEILDIRNYISKPNKNEERKYIWTMWWQGEEELPDVLRICYRSHLKYIDREKYQYIMITKDNYSNYVDVPHYIKSKLDEGIISFTHFSDLLRIMLIRKYGGAWIDITLLLTSPLDEEIFKYTFYSFNQKGSVYTPRGMGQEITQCQWAGFFLCSSEPNNILFSFVEKCLLKYWKNFNYTIDYFLLNLIIRLGCIEIDQIGKAIKSVPQNNIDLYTLQPLMNDIFNNKTFDTLTKRTHFFKLTQKIPYVENIGEVNTFYKELNNRML